MCLQVEHTEQKGRIRQNGNDLQHSSLLGYKPEICGVHGSSRGFTPVTAQCRRSTTFAPLSAVYPFQSTNPLISANPLIW